MYSSLKHPTPLSWDRINQFERRYWQSCLRILIYPVQKRQIAMDDYRNRRYSLEQYLPENTVVDNYPAIIGRDVF